MVENLDDREFAEMLAAIWERVDWDTEITEQGGEYMVAGDRTDGKRGLILVAPGDEGAVGEEPIQTIQSLAADKGIDVPVAATRSSFTDGATQLADANGIHLVDPVTLEETASVKGFEDLLKKYSGGGIFSRLRNMIPIPGIPGLPSISTPGVGGRSPLLIGAVVLVAAILFVQFGPTGMLGGLLGSLPIPDLGIVDAIGGLLGGLPLPTIGFGGGGFEMTAVSLAEGEGDPFTVKWNGRTQESVVGPNGTAFDPIENRTYVVVQMNVSNPGAEPVEFGPEAFAIDTEAGRFGPQPLEGAEKQLPVFLPPFGNQTGYVVFAVPDDTESATLLALPGPDVKPIEFQRDKSLEFEVRKE